MFQGLSLMKSEFIYFWSIYVAGFDLLFFSKTQICLLLSQTLKRTV